MIQKSILRLPLAGLYVFQFSALLLGIIRYSYRFRELLVCWLFFCSLFAVLALMLLGAVLACYAGRYFVGWLRVANTVIPELAVGLAELPQAPNPAQRILVAESLTVVAIRYSSDDALDTHLYLLVAGTTSEEEHVQK